MAPDISRDPLYDETVNIDLEPEDALDVLLSSDDEGGGDSDEECDPE